MALADALHGLFRLPGATYACVVERDGGRVLAEAGDGEGGAGDGEGVVPYSVAGWGTAVAAMFDTTSGDELDDVMITGRRSYHLVRPLGPGAAVLIYLRLDRARSNLAAARRELAAVPWGGSGGATGAAPAAGRRPESGGADAGGRRRAAAEVPAPGAGVRPSRAGADPRPRGAVPSPPPRAPAVTRVPAALPPAATSGGGARLARTATTGRLRSAPAAESPGPRIPLPRRAPTRRPADEPHRRGGARAPGDVQEGPGAPDGFALPAVLGQSWARDPGTLRRLIAGLRRLT